MQGERAKWLPFSQEAARQFGCNVLRIRRRSPVSRDEQLPTGGERFVNKVDSFRDSCGKVREQLGNRQVFAPDFRNSFYLLLRRRHSVHALPLGFFVPVTWTAAGLRLSNLYIALSQPQINEALIWRSAI